MAGHKVGVANKVASECTMLQTVTCHAVRNRIQDTVQVHLWSTSNVNVPSKVEQFVP